MHCERYYFHSGRFPLLYKGEIQNAFIGMKFVGQKILKALSTNIYTDLMQRITDMTKLRSYLIFILKLVSYFVHLS